MNLYRTKHEIGTCRGRIGGMSLDRGGLNWTGNMNVIGFGSIRVRFGSTRVRARAEWYRIDERELRDRHRFRDECIRIGPDDTGGPRDRANNLIVVGCGWARCDGGEALILRGKCWELCV